MDQVNWINTTAHPVMTPVQSFKFQS
ncbi:uncharacterized protein METZ01_LOCUS65688 [marine metagenome]|uniref:Uncharacterized protein n=1 Tax=marine metagenome TaxID=408172 RepID=A0A381TAU4_9ZZZZ